MKANPMIFHYPQITIRKLNENIRYLNSQVALHTVGSIDTINAVCANSALLLSVKDGNKGQN